jgi:hypothetical protein
MSARQQSWRRIANGVVWVVIGLWLLGQVAGLLVAGMPAVELRAPWLGELRVALAMVGVPAVLLILGKVVVHAKRSWRSARSRRHLALCLLIGLGPALAHQALAVRQQRALDLKEAAEVAADDKLRNPPPTAEFLAGSAWAAAHRPEWPSSCAGSLDFVVGCRTYFFAHLQKPKPPGQGRYEGMTTAECQREVNANYAAAEALYLRAGNPHGAAVIRRRNWLPELQDCENYDKLVENRFMPQAYGRLQAVIDALKARQPVSADAHAAVLKDMAAMAAVRDQPYKAAYLKLADEYVERNSGAYHEPSTVYPRISCAEYQAEIDKMRRQAERRTAEQQALKRPDGVITNGARHAELNRQGLDMLWDWKYFNDGAKAAGCEMTAP